MRKQGPTLAGVIRGDLPLAKYIFRDGRKRRLIKQLQENGWPIFDLAGRRCAFPDDLDAAIAEVRPANKRQRKPERTAVPAKTASV